MGLLDPVTAIASCKVTDYSSEGIRKILKQENERRNPAFDSIQYYKELVKANRIATSAYLSERKRIEEEHKQTALFVIIKADDAARYRNLVDILDEMNITNTRSYAIVDITPQEVALASKVLGAQR